MTSDQCTAVSRKNVSVIAKFDIKSCWLTLKILHAKYPMNDYIKLNNYISFTALKNQNIKNCQEKCKLQINKT